MICLYDPQTKTVIGLDGLFIVDTEQQEVHRIIDGPLCVDTKMFPIGVENLSLNYHTITILEECRQAGF